MEDSSEAINNFEKVLMKNARKKRLLLYRNSENKNKQNLENQSYNPQTVISNVSLQLKAIQKADTVINSKHTRKYLQKFKKSCLLPVNEFVEDNLVAQTSNGTKFETQFELDTQLMDIIDNAEELVHPKSVITHEIERKSKINDNKNPESTPTISLYENHNINSPTTENFGRKSDNIEGKCQLNENHNKEIKDSNVVAKIDPVDILVEDEDIPSSYVFLPEKKSKTPSPLVFDLNTFEDFEKIAVPVIEHNPDTKSAKQLINSQIVGRELLIQCDDQSLYFADDTSLSPVLKISVDKLKVTKNEGVNSTKQELFTAKEFMKDSVFLKDEIIFSSDEESEYIKNEFHDLPLTCALKTSFYNQPEILDKTIYVGFQTASNRSIQISADSYKKAKSFLDSFDDDGDNVGDDINKVTLTELVNMCDKLHKKSDTTNVYNCKATETNINLDRKEISMDNEEIYVDSDKLNVNNVDINLKSNYIDLKQESLKDDNKKMMLTSMKRKGDDIMARNKKVKLSEMALINYNQICLGINLEDNISLEKLVVEKSKQSSNVTENKVNSSDDIQHIDEDIINEFDVPLLENKNEKRVDYHNVKTASLKKDGVDIIEKFNNNNGIVDNNLFNVKYKDFKVNHDNSSTIPDIVGFKTASNKNIKITKQALAKSRLILDDFNKLPLDISNPEISQELNLDQRSKVYGFKTASNKDIQISVNALTKSRSVFQDIIENDHNFNLEPEKYQSQITKYESRSNTYMGFRKSDNKEIKITEEAYHKTKNMFENIVMNDEEFAKDFEENIKYKGDVLEAIQERPELHDLITSQNEIANDFNTEFDGLSVFPKADTIPKFCGFKTASNKSVSISEKAIIESKNVFADIGLDYDFMFLSKKKTLNKSIEKTKQSLAKSRCIIEDCNECPLDMNRLEIPQDKCSNLNQKSKDCGFKTASNKEIKISFAALTKSSSVFKDIVENDHGIDTGSDENLNKKVKYKSCSDTYVRKVNNEENNISEEAYTKIQNMLNDVVKKDEDFANKNEKELKHKDDIVEVIHEDPKLPELNPLQLEIANNFNTDFDSVSVFPKATDVIKFCGFITASNKKVNVSEKAFIESKKIFADIDLDNGSNFIIKNKITNLSENSKSETNVNYERVANINRCKISSDKVIMDPYLFQSNSELKVASNNKHNFNKKYLNQNELIRDKKIDDITSYENTKDTLEFDLKDVNLEIRKIDIDKPKFQPFQTASMKPIAISDKALAESKALLEDIGNSKYSSILVQPHINVTQTSCKGFQTASQQSIKMSDYALAKNIKLFKDIDNENNIVKFNDEHNNMVQGEMNKSAECKELVLGGFQTSRGKPVEISAEALAKSKLLFEDFRNELDEPEQAKFRFQGFQTGNKNKVSISNEALIKSKELFNNMHKIETSTLKTMETNSRFGGFQTANNKKILISEQALQRGCQVFQDINVDFSKGFDKQMHKEKKSSNETGDHKIQETLVDSESVSYKSIDKPINVLTESRNQFTDSIDNCKNKSNSLISTNNPENLEELMDTQVINNLEETLYTEDFCKNTTPKNAKRSGSPILSCPKAKKRKIFQTPYKTGFISNKKIPLYIKTTSKPINESIMLFNDDYKKTKRYSLKDLANVEKNSQTPKMCFYNLKFETLLNFRFTRKRNDVTDYDMSVEDITKLFKNAVNTKLIPDGWLDNHIKLVIWKLLSYEMIFPNTLSGVCTVRNLLDQLKYRYDKELYNTERPALRKILEKDDVASKTLVLCVAAIYVDGVSVSSVVNLTANVELLLTDGWYCVKSTIDKMLTKLVYDEKIRIGSKIVTNGAELLNCDQGIAPWEDTSYVRLKIFGNSTRPARWDARLGYHRKAAILTSLSNVKVEGGKVSKLRLYVTRVYPALFVEKFEDGSTVTRSERLETIHQLKYESERQTMMEKLYEEMEKELSDQVNLFYYLMAGLHIFS
ncbi:unnamed protein product [Diatraea saccharalis]|uniref:Breast cancer type 2 susceptibility protein n=1 Tax=Diatraea saccharalis TaxID=40085 RepID=A0A9P0C2I1_9NEOP|nr:unnamed protein product [Diatraea saccharalis]